MRRILAGGLVLGLVAGSVLLVAGALRARGGPAPEALLEMPYRLADGSVERLRVDGRPTVLVLFHSGCTFCLAELEQMEARLEELAGVRLVLLTPEPDLPRARLAAESPRLLEAANASWGTVEPSALQRAAGDVPTPATFAWRADGSFAERFVGLTSVTDILAAIHHE